MSIQICLDWGKMHSSSVYVFVFLVFGVLCKVSKGSQEDTRTCPSGWYMFRDFCYLYVDARLNWNDAMVNCDRMEGYLAEVLDRETDNFLIDLVGRHGTSGFGPWLGATDKTTEGHWIWASSQKPMIYHNWFGGGTNGGRSENCLHYFQFNHLQWNDASCTAWKFPSVCQRPT